MEQIKNIKGYLRYRTITYTPNVSYEGDRLRILLFGRKVVFRSPVIQVSVFLTIPWFLWRHGEY